MNPLTLTPLFSVVHPSGQSPKRLWLYPASTPASTLVAARDCYHASAAYRNAFDRMTRHCDALPATKHLLVLNALTETDASQATYALRRFAAQAAFRIYLQEECAIAPSVDDLLLTEDQQPWNVYEAAGAITLEQGLLAAYWQGHCFDSQANLTLAEKRELFDTQLRALKIAPAQLCFTIMRNVDGSIHSRGTDCDLSELQDAMPLAPSQLARLAWQYGVAEMVCVDPNPHPVSWDFIPLLNPQLPQHQHALRQQVGTFQIKAPVEDTVAAQRHMLRYSNNAGAIARAIKNLVADPSEANIALAAEVISNPYDQARIAGLRQLAPIAAMESIRALLNEYRCELPAALVRDLAVVKVSPEQEEKIQGLSVQLEDLGLAPHLPDDVLYFFQTRWAGDNARWLTMFQLVTELLTTTDRRRQLTPYKISGVTRRGITTWEELMLYVDSKIDFPTPGAVNRTTAERRP